MYLTILTEFGYDNNIYFLNSNLEIYKKANWVKLPHSPELNYVKYNAKNYFTKIEQPPLEMYHQAAREMLSELENDIGGSLDILLED